jgi:arylsulfatase A-like enzyme
MVVQRKVLLLVLAGLLLSCQPGGGPANVVLIAVDTLRPDHLGCYGYSRPTSPSIDRLAAEGVRFENAISACPWTLPSFATVFTSLYPSQHGAGSLQARLRTAFPTLAMMMLKRGYSTAGIVNNSTLGADFKMDRGFEYYDLPPPMRGRLADGTTDDALKWIDANVDKPFFLFVHFFDPHMPYEPPAPYDTLFNPGYSGPVGRTFHMAGPIGQAQIEAPPIAPQDFTQVVSLYDGEIAFTDAAVGKLIAGLDERGLREKTLVVFIADHGEELLDHNGLGHGHTLFDELLRVPIIISWPGKLPSGQVVSRQVRLLDVVPTILDLVRVTTDAHLEGASLRPLLTGKGNPKAPETSLLPADIAFSGALLYGGERKSVRAHPWKLVYEVATGDARLYDLQHDPGEAQDVSGGQPAVLDLLSGIALKTIFGISDTWYVELDGGGQDHTFDIKVSLKGPGSGAARIYLYGLLDADGRIVDAEDGIAPEATTSSISIPGLRLNRALTLAFKVEPKSSQLRFDLKIDGKHTLASTYLGEDLSRPTEMPFSQKGAPGGAESEGEPATRPTAPYLLVWHSGSRFGGETPAKLDDETKKQLRALGYLQ